jgi:hypothetical protein
LKYQGSYPLIEIHSPAIAGRHSRKLSTDEASIRELVCFSSQPGTMLHEKRRENSLDGKGDLVRENNHIERKPSGREPRDLMGLFGSAREVNFEL